MMSEPNDELESALEGVSDSVEKATDLAGDILEATDKAFEGMNEESGNPQPAEPENELSELEALQNELNEKNDQLLRAAAEIENVRKRGRRDAEEIRKFGTIPVLTDLLAVVDNLERAIESAESSESDAGLLDGVKMVAGQLHEILEKHQCKRIDALGQPFDPNLHEAIQMQPSTDYDANQVSLVARTGYTLHDRVLRTAQVFVSTGSPADAS